MIKFPSEFLFGIATSAYQIEGDNTNADWWRWEERGRVKHRSGKACNHWQLYAKDIELMHRMGIDAYRFSIEWSRVFPKPNEVDWNSLARYREIVDMLKKLGIEPMITLHHFTNPVWFADLGGWRKKENVDHFARFVEIVADEFRDVKLWITLNEPNVYAYMGFIEGTWPPGLKNPQVADEVLKNLVEAHARAYEILRGRGLVGIAHNMMWFVPRSGRKLDVSACRRAEEIWNTGFIKGVLYGKLRGFVRRYRVKESNLDFIGINYYTAFRVGHSWNPFKMFLSIELLESPMRSTMGYYIHPRGIREVVSRTWDAFRVPICITENGFAVENDDDRIEALLQHLAYLWLAIKDGVKVKGHFYWSLLDNYEWDKGYTQRFGLIEVNFVTFERKPRKSAFIYSEIARNKGISDELIDRYGLRQLLGR